MLLFVSFIAASLHPSCVTRIVLFKERRWRRRRRRRGRVLTEHCYYAVPERKITNLHQVQEECKRARRLPQRGHIMRSPCRYKQPRAVTEIAMCEARAVATLGALAAISTTEYLAALAPDSPRKFQQPVRQCNCQDDNESIRVACTRGASRSGLGSLAPKVTPQLQSTSKILVFKAP